MFDVVTAVPGDPILGLIAQFKHDPNPHKVDLGVGVYRDAHGLTPILRVVKEAEQRLVDTEVTKTYIGSHGDPRYGNVATRLVLGDGSEVIAAERTTASQTPGGSGALRLAMDFVAKTLQRTRIWLPDPTWSNHMGTARAAGLAVERYPYVGADNAFDFDAVLAALQRVPSGNVVLLQACCQNPTGYDPDAAQWAQILDVMRGRQLLPLLDFAYQGFGTGIDEDARVVRQFASALDELLIAQSCSKNFGLYRERAGTFIAIAKDRQKTADVRTCVATLARANYSHPPWHGAAIVTTVLESAELTQRWRGEVDAMRDRIQSMRRAFVAETARRGMGDRFGCIGRQIGMFSFTGLTPPEIDRLRDEFGIYMV
ncbi:MAG TPA: amino acid aminotransferase, partial [Rhodanobacteraceae bacterium]